MLAHSRRYFVIVALLLAAVALTWGPRLAGSRTAPALGERLLSSGSTPGAESLAEHIYWIDIEGWYRITPYETAVRSPYDLTGDSTAAVAAAIPAQLGDWQQAGPDDDVADDPAVIAYLNHPIVALQRTYRDAAGQQAILTVLANKGQDSFLLFSHTPETCYPGLLWQVVEQRRESAPLDGGMMYAQYLLAEHAESHERLLVLFWYVWDNSERDPDGGVTSMRVTLPIPAGQDADKVLARAWDLIRLIFPVTVPWERF